MVGIITEASEVCFPRENSSASQQQSAKIPPAGVSLRPQSGTDRFVFSEQPSRLRPGEGDGLGGERCRVNVATHQDVHLLLSLHLRLLRVKGHLLSDVCV